MHADPGRRIHKIRNNLKSARRNSPKPFDLQHFRDCREEVPESEEKRPRRRRVSSHRFAKVSQNSYVRNLLDVPQCISVLYGKSMEGNGLGMVHSSKYTHCSYHPEIMYLKHGGFVP